MRKGLVLSLAAVLVVASALIARALGPEVASAASPCQFQKSSSTVAFCDSFDQAAAANDSRSGPLDPTVWGVSEVMAGSGSNYDSGTDASQGIVDSIAPVDSTSPCGGSNLVPTANLQVCNASLYDSVNDDGGQTILAMYPRQPFDIAGRTGDITFDVGNNSQGDHGAWPSFVYTDQPVPTPYTSASGLAPFARNSFGVTFAAQCNYAGGGSQWCPNSADTGTCAAADGVSVDQMYETVNYQEKDVSFDHAGCVAKSTRPSQQNHVEILMSASQVQVWATDPGSTTLKEIAWANVTMPLTRGLVWMEDVHYNGDKFGSQQSNTFGWDNFGFDGPILPRDLGFDVPNRDVVNPDGSEQLGWGSDPLTVRTRSDFPVTASDISAASGALVEFNWYAQADSVPTVSLNGNPVIGTAWPGSWDYDWRTIAVPVPLGEVVTGQNTIAFTGNTGGIANVDLILQGAGGVPTCLDPSDCSGTQTSPTPRSTPTSSPPTASGGRLPISGSQVYTNGVNLPWIAYGNDVGGNAWGEYGFHSDTTKLDSDFSTMQQQGVTTARVWLFADARAGIKFDSSGNPTGLDPEDMADLDALTSAAAAHNVHLNLVLFDVSFAKAAVNYGYGVSGGGHGGLINNGTTGHLLEQNVVLPVLRHLASNPAVFSIETMNEPEAAIAGEGSGTITLTNFNAWTQMVAADVHATDPGVLVTVGSASSNWVRQYKGHGLDYYEVHAYGTSYSPGLTTTPASSFGLDRPIVIGEYGASQNTSTFKAQMDGFYGEGYAGAWVWSFGDIDSVGTYDAPTMKSWNAAHPATQIPNEALVAQGATPAAVMTGSGAEQVAFRDGDGTIWAAASSGGTWQPAARTPSGTVGSDPSLVSPGDGTAQLYWKGTDGNLWRLSRASGTWSGLQGLGSGPLGSQPHAVIPSSATVDVFWRGTDNNLWYDWSSSGAWHGPMFLTTAGNLASDPYPVVSAPGVVDVFWKGSDGNLWHKWAINSSWYGPQSLGSGPLGSEPHPVATTNSGVIDVFWRGTDNNLWHDWYVGRWYGPQSLGSGPLGSEPHPASPGNGSVRVFWKGTNAGIWYDTYSSGWSGPRNSGASALDSSPQPVATGPGVDDVFWRGADGRLWHDVLTNGTWSGQQPLT